MFETIGLHSPTPDLGDTIGDHGPCSCMLAFWVLSQRILLPVGLASEALGDGRGNLCRVMTAILFGLFQFDQLFRGYRGLGFGYIAFEIQYLVGDFLSHFNNLVISQGLH